ncbi:hypothetical protein SMSP2_01157 [Limihaloglobus sulfuriphilus]|uniref:DUF4292 domain-containing protein n=1 Tax=Limihaloglobus sulfuriphilus TaxID=1851148 RepID=A0A1Q2MDL6_9BACT|nr:DUF4292 domain-containing protein [Limihaloglobus sulfuriphilus]AQQ70796.1 hypothetical protein SMSP2_01157 [Limihaloglobus sulfuriphilus]
MKIKITVSILISIFLLGCGQQFEKSERKYNSSMNFLAKQKASAVPFKAQGSGRAEFIDADGEKNMENITRIDVIFNPPNKLYVSMDHLLQKSAVSLGLTGHEFWIWSRFRDRNDIYWGQQNMLVMDNRLPVGLRPEAFLECLGHVNYEKEEELFVSDELSIGIGNGRGQMVKALEFSPDDHTLRRIGYFNSENNLIMLCELDDYRPVSLESEYILPRKIRLYFYKRQSELSIKLDKITLVDPEDEKYSRAFNMPSKDRVKEVYLLTESGEFIQEK